MCRQWNVWGWSLMAFGAGILLGSWIDGGFWGHVLGLVLIGFGFGILKRR